MLGIASWLVVRLLLLKEMLMCQMLLWLRYQTPGHLRRMQNLLSCFWC